MMGIRLMSILSDNESVATVSDDTDGAGGVAVSHWFVAIVNHNSERKTAELLSSRGYETYVASQPEYRVWRNGRRRLIDRVVIPSMLFVRCSERDRLRALSVPGVFRFLSNRAGNLNIYGKPVAIIPDVEIRRLQFILGQSDVPVEFIGHEYSGGERVRVSRGSLTGLEGVVLRAESGSREIIVSLNLLGSAKVRIAVDDLEPLAG